MKNLNQKTMKKLKAKINKAWRELLLAGVLICVLSGIFAFICESTGVKWIGITAIILAAMAYVEILFALLYIVIISIFDKGK